MRTLNDLAVGCNEAADVDTLLHKEITQVLLSLYKSEDQRIPIKG